MTSDESIYRILQQHLDEQAIGFPSTWSGADIRLLKRLFTPDEAKLALHLTYKPSPTEQIMERAAADFFSAQTASLLDSMFTKGAIGWKEKNGISHWYVLPLVVGMYECQDGNPSPEFLADADAYFSKVLSFGRSFVSVKPSQMRTIPINKSIPVEHHVATYDQVRSIVQNSPGPFVVLPCICRRSEAMKGRPCKKTSREETCLAFGDMAKMVLRRKHCREVTRDEVLAIIQRNEEDGLVLQPANTRQPEFICSCCGCCCGMLSYQKFLPHPVDFWSSNYQAEVSSAACVHCGTCVSRCQVNAITLTGPSGEAQVNLSRCIGCGLCVPTCPSKAVRLNKKASETAPPKDEEALNDEIIANKKGTIGQLTMVLKVALKMKQ
ncbi:MAG: 4Fe-4S binding protein [Nitrospirae bacterium]|nr:4Fe-4S binding protein [Nitrospirota bacterium]NTW66559.1 4Fe-4S binding protein [Nitrospirota bacterium]